MNATNPTNAIAPPIPGPAELFTPNATHTPTRISRKPTTFQPAPALVVLTCCTGCGGADGVHLGLQTREGVSADGTRDEVAGDGVAQLDLVPGPLQDLAALLGVYLTGDNNVFVQVGLVVLMGLACKNAILIVEFARELEMQGRGIVEAALEACRLRLRPIVMTSIAFIAGTIPLVFSHGAGAEVRSATGITVFGGMLGVTLFGLFLTPVFYVALRKLVTRGAAAAPAHPLEPSHA